MCLADDARTRETAAGSIPKMTLLAALAAAAATARLDETSFAPATAAARAPQQLNETSFAQCLSNGTDTPDLDAIKTAHDFRVDDGLLIYTALYAGQRFAPINKTQQAAWERWAQGFESFESQLVEAIIAEAAPALSPRRAFRGAVAACGGDFGPQGDVFCGALVCHNVFRAIGRRDTYVDSDGVDYAPAWLKNNETYVMDTLKPAMEQAMLPLRNDGGGDGWGEWYARRSRKPVNGLRLAELGLEDAASATSFERSRRPQVPHLGPPSLRRARGRAELRESRRGGRRADRAPRHARGADRDAVAPARGSREGKGRRR